jgi:hypothetical protein
MILQFLLLFFLKKKIRVLMVANVRPQDSGRHL